MSKSEFIDIADEVIAEDLEIIEELIEEEIKPLIDYRKQLEKKIFDKAFEEVKTLEKETTGG